MVNDTCHCLIDTGSLHIAFLAQTNIRDALLVKTNIKMRMFFDDRHKIIPHVYRFIHM